MNSDLFLHLLLALVFGAAIGLERESSKQGEPHVGGIRTFALISLMGAVAGLFILHGALSVGLVIAIGFLALLIANYVTEGIETKSFGITSELSALAAFFIGMLVMVDIIPLSVTIILLVMVIFLLSLKARTTKLMEGITQQEVQSFISYAIIALVVFPVLPDYAYKLKDMPFLMDMLGGLGVNLERYDALDLINFRRVWFIVVLITGIDVFGYILGRIVGTQHGFALTSFMAGFISSTSTTQSLAQRSAKSTMINQLVGAALLANLASFIQIFLLVGPLNVRWLLSIAPAILMMIVAAGILSFVFFKQEEKTPVAGTADKKAEQIFSLLPALKFAGLLIGIKIVTKICLIEFGQSGFIISSIIASFAGIDAIIVNLADMAGNSITFEFAFLTFITINATNLLSKSFYSFLQGNRKFALRFFLSILVVIGVSAIWLLFI